MCVCPFPPGSYPHRAVSGGAEGLRVGEHRRRSCSGRQPQLQPGRLNSSLHLSVSFFSAPLTESMIVDIKLQTKLMFKVFVNAHM